MSDSAVSGSCIAFTHGRHNPHDFKFNFICCWLIARSTAQGHLRAVHKFKFRTQVEYNTKHAHDMKAKHTNIIPKGSPFGIALVKHGK